MRSSSTVRAPRNRAEASGLKSWSWRALSSNRLFSRSSGSRAACAARSSSATRLTSFCFRGISTCRNCTMRSHFGRCASRRLCSSWASPKRLWLSSRNAGIFTISLSTESSNVLRSLSVEKHRRQNWQAFLARDFSRNFSYMCLALSVIAKSLRASSTCSRCFERRAAKSPAPALPAAPVTPAGMAGTPSSAARRASSSRKRRNSASAAADFAVPVLRRFCTSWHFCL
mmetsp:Transcript_19929/g.56133  ORF Transcript_19929/g.56133 Transcript_19929/m.56133 type:complete len:228 (+) Transcript_19929:1625-2308(+)